MLANEALCRSALAKGRASPEAMDIRNVTLVNARTTVVNCLVLNIPVDVTANHVESVAAQLLLEETDRAVGQAHLFKRTVLLVKAWCRHESCRYGDGVTVLSSRTGHLSTHAINVMVACLFVDKHLGDLSAMHPIHMLARFLNVYASLDWTREKLTLLGDDDDVDDADAAGSTVRAAVRALCATLHPPPLHTPRRSDRPKPRHRWGALLLNPRNRRRSVGEDPARGIRWTHVPSFCLAYRASAREDPAGGCDGHTCRLFALLTERAPTRGGGLRGRAPPGTGAARTRGGDQLFLLFGSPASICARIAAM